MSALLFWLALFSVSASTSVQISGPAIPVTVSQIEHFDLTGTQSTFGKLKFRGGLVVKSKLRKFGGLSGIHVEKQGSEAILVSDLGYILHADLTYSDGRLAGIAIPRMIRAPLPGAIKHRDLEDIAVGAGGEIHLALERNNRQIATISPKSGKATAKDLIALPEAGQLLGFNKGIESIAIFPEGSENAGQMIAIAERPNKQSGDQIPCWIVGAGRCAVKVRGKYDVTSAKFLDNGDLIILERRFTPAFDVGMRLRRIRQADIGVGKILDGEVLMEASLAQQIDNMEGLAVHRDKSGATILTIVSDDNLNFFQRTLILQFELFEQSG